MLSSVLQEWTGLSPSKICNRILDCPVLIYLQDQRETKEWGNGHPRRSMASFLVCRLHVWSGRSMEGVISKSPSDFCRLSINYWMTYYHWFHRKSRPTNMSSPLPALLIRLPKQHDPAMPEFMAWLVWLRPQSLTLQLRLGLCFIIILLFCELTMLPSRSVLLSAHRLYSLGRIQSQIQSDFTTAPLNCLMILMNKRRLAIFLYGGIGMIQIWWSYTDLTIS